MKQITRLLFIIPFLLQSQQIINFHGQQIELQESDGYSGVMSLQNFYIYDVTELMDMTDLSRGYGFASSFVPDNYAEYEYHGDLDMQGGDIGIANNTFRVYGDTVNVGEVKKWNMFISKLEVISPPTVIYLNPTVNMFPNPATDLVSFVGSQIIAKIVIYDLTGNIVEVIKVGTHKFELDVSGYINGTYLVQVWFSNFVKIKKMVIQ